MEKSILTYIDYYSSYPKAYSLQEVTSREEIKALTDISVRSGFPEELVSDKGKQFVCGESEAFLKSCEIKHIRVFQYYARSNGKLEENFRAAIRKVNPGKRSRLEIHALQSKSASN